MRRMFVSVALAAMTLASPALAATTLVQAGKLLDQPGKPPRGRVLCVGDGVLTDIAGAVGAGLDCALIPGGIHGAAHGLAMGEMPDAARLDALLAGHAVRPTYAIPSLRW